jgi:hypothetical protein
MRPKKADEKVDGYRINRDQPGLNQLRDRLVKWAAGVRDAAMDYATYGNVDIPVDDRQADVWEPLLIVAELAGGDWPLVARAACRAMCAQSAAEDAEYGPDQQLLSDIREIFGQAEFMRSGDLVAHLKALPDSPWDDEMLTPAKLASRLRGYGIKPKRDHGGNARGYYRNNFRDAWGRYLPENPSKPSNPSETYSDLPAFSDTSLHTDIGPDTLPSEKPSTSEEPSEETPSSDPVSDILDASDGFSQKKGAPSPRDAANAALVAKGKAIFESGKYAPKKRSSKSQTNIDEVLSDTADDLNEALGF